MIVKIVLCIPSALLSNALMILATYISKSTFSALHHVLEERSQEMLTMDNQKPMVVCFAEYAGTLILWMELMIAEKKAGREGVAVETRVTTSGRNVSGSGAMVNTGEQIKAQDEVEFSAASDFGEDFEDYDESDSGIVVDTKEQIVIREALKRRADTTKQIMIAEATRHAAAEYMAKMEE
ncbi:hypothetical protein G6011_00043 [Alternaria panax]|uniref:Uncharacterized protein n=1 Tax=Alternaria panax TaxID=48097 RepID=A0AAD4II62_9PLEO|nr:hypothetical protein G6011_00043 [Alternaria panax]